VLLNSAWGVGSARVRRSCPGDRPPSRLRCRVIPAVLVSRPRGSRNMFLAMRRSPAFPLSYLAHSPRRAGACRSANARALVRRNFTHIEHLVARRFVRPGQRLWLCSSHHWLHALRRWIDGRTRRQASRSSYPRRPTRLTHLHPDAALPRSGPVACPLTTTSAYQPACRSCCPGADPSVRFGIRWS